MRPDMSKTPLRKLSQWSAVVATAIVTGQAAAQFVPNETEVCPASARVYDPEFHVVTQQVAFFDGQGGLRVAPVLANGTIGSTGCIGTLLTRSVTISLPGLPYKAGPEWADSQRGVELYFTSLNKDGRAAMSRANFDGRWRQSELPETQDRGLALVSTDATDPEPRLVYMHTAALGSYRLAWREASRPETETTVPGTVDPSTGGAPRWVPGRRALTLALPDAEATRQAVYHDVDTAQSHFLTSDAGQKDEVWMWPAPEFGGALALMVVADGCCLRIYRQDAAGPWLLYREIKASSFSRRSNIFSPEVLVHEGRSFVVVQLAAQRVSASEIWMVEVGVGGLAPVQLSDPAKRNLSRTEPEWMKTSEGVFVYVTASETGSRFALNRLKTPLAPSAAH